MRAGARAAMLAGLLIGLTLGTSSGCGDQGQAATSTSGTPRGPGGRVVPSGTMIDVVLEGAISSETASVGDEWYGRLADDVSLRDGGVIPSGSSVSGLVTVAVSAGRGARAMLDLAITGITSHGQSESITASGEPEIASAPRGATFGGANVADNTAASAAEQVVLGMGSTMSFRVDQTATLR